MSGSLIILRHGESKWNAQGKWTGTTDVHLSAKGRHEAELFGRELAGIKIDHAFISEQVRTLETLEGEIDGMGIADIPHEVTSALNERDYGIYTGKNKWEIEKELGHERFQDIRRGWDVPIPEGETLKEVYGRSVPFYLDKVFPRLVKGENILIVAHGNSIRSLMKYIESISDKGVEKLEMIFGTILTYKVDKEGRMTHKTVVAIDTTPPRA